MKVLFVCVGNSCRSQMAEAIARQHGIEAASAGTQPAASIARNAVAVMAERGIQMDGQRPKLLDEFDLSSFDRTITMGCGVAESCPSLRTDEDWGLDDPVGQAIGAFRATADAIERHVLALKSQAEAS